MASQPEHSVPFAGQTRYMHMLVELDRMPWMYNIIASIAHWTLLAGYLIVPGTFTALQKSGRLQNTLTKDQVGQAVLSTVQNPPLLAISCILFVVSTAALGWLYWEWRSNYIWLVNRLFSPIIMNAAAGLATGFPEIGVTIYTLLIILGTLTLRGTRLFQERSVIPIIRTCILQYVTDS